MISSGSLKHIKAFTKHGVGRKRRHPDKVYPEYFVMAELLAEPGITYVEAARQLGIHIETLKKWHRLPGYKKVVAQMIEERNTELEMITAHRLAQKVEAIKELGRMYDETPDEYIDKIIQVLKPAEEGEEGEPGEPTIENIAVYKSNIAAKASLIKDILKIVEPQVVKHEHSGSLSLAVDQESRDAYLKRKSKYQEVVADFQEIQDIEDSVEGAKEGDDRRRLEEGSTEGAG